MKKIISLLSVFAMIATMFTTVAFADANNKFYVEEKVDGTNVTLAFYMTTNKMLRSASVTLDLTEALASCDGINFEMGADAKTFNVNTTQKVFTWAIQSTGETTGTLSLGTVTFLNVKSDFSLPSKRASTAKDASNVNVVGDFTDEQVGYTVKAPVTGPSLVENPYVFSFTADEETDIKIIHSRNGDRTYDLPDFVDGEMEVWGLLKFSGKEDVQAGDVFTIKTAKNRVELETIKTITVQAADLQ